MQHFEARNYLDRYGRPAGGTVTGVGLAISWQDGPLVDEDDFERRAPNGCFVETLIAAAIQRIEFYERAGFGCPENRRAIVSLNIALDQLDQLEKRTARREAAGVEGTHEMAAGDDQAPNFDASMGVE